MAMTAEWLDGQVLEAIDRFYSAWRRRLEFDPGAREPVITASLAAEEIPWGWSGADLDRKGRTGAVQASLVRLWRRGALLRSEAPGERGGTVQAYERAPEGTMPPKAPKKAPKRSSEGVLGVMRDALTEHGWTVGEDRGGYGPAPSIAKGGRWFVASKDFGWRSHLGFRTLTISVGQRGGFEATLRSGVRDETTTKDVQQAVQWIEGK